jgi:hypothetical protein
MGIGLEAPLHFFLRTDLSTAPILGIGEETSPMKISIARFVSASLLV